MKFTAGKHLRLYKVKGMLMYQSVLNFEIHSPFFSINI